MSDFLMPSLGSDMEDGILIEWEKSPGEAVNQGDVLAVVETQKGAIEIEAYESGVLGQWLVPIGQKVPVGTPLATIETAGEVSIGADTNHGVDTTDTTETIKATTDPLAAMPDTESGLDHEKLFNSSDISRITASPAARAQAVKYKVDLSSLTGSDPSGAIVLSDVHAALQAPRREQTNAGSESVVNDNSHTAGSSHKESTKEGMRSAIAAAMSRSKREIPHYYLSHTFPVHKTLDFVNDTNAQREPGQRLVIGVFFIKALAMALRRFPEFNGHYKDVFYPSESIHVGMAIALRGGGLVAPAIHNADNKSIDELMELLRDLVMRVRAGRFRAQELSDPTITLTSLGDRGVDSLYGVIYPPQVAVAGFGTPAQKPSALDGKVVSLPTVTVTIAADHRVSDGHRGSLFLYAVAKALQIPDKLI